MWTYTIYHQPELWPPYRVRSFAIAPGVSTPRDVIGVAATLELARLCLPPDVGIPFARSPSDAPEIVETWL
jgi:hypothetical protein